MLLPCTANAADAPPPNIRVYGFAQVDWIQDFNRVNPNWRDALRPSRIPTTDGQFGQDGDASISVKQSRLGAEGTAGSDPVFARVEFDFFGVGSNEGKVTPRLRHAYGTWRSLLIGQTNTLFMDGDVFPNVVEYWGPTGMVFLRTPQFRWAFVDNDRMYFAAAIEYSADDPDPGNIRDLDPNLGSNIKPYEPLPDATAQFRYKGGWGHVQVAGILRNLGYETMGTPDNEPSDSLLGWGVDLTANIRIGERDKILPGFVFGHGIANYMNDGGMDIAPENEAPPGAPEDLKGVAVPLLGVTIYYDHYWSDKFSTSLGYSRTQVDNTNFQADNAYHAGDYASINLLYTPTPQALIGLEAQWGRREDNNGAKGDDFRLQFSAKYTFSGNFLGIP
jgi:hypothetical protein